MTQPSSPYMDTRKTSYQHIKTSEPYETIGDSGIVGYFSIITDECIRTIGDTLFIKHVGTVETSNVNIKMVDPDIAIKNKNETLYDIFVDIVFGRTVGTMWLSPTITSRGGVKIHPPLPHLCIQTSKIEPPSWLKLLHPEKKGSSSASCASQPPKTTIIIAIDQ